MVFNDKKEGFNRDKQMDFVSRLTFVRGLKDIPANEGVKERKRKKDRKIKNGERGTILVNYSI